MLQTIGLLRQKHRFTPTKPWVFSNQTIGLLWTSIRADNPNVKIL